MFFAPTTRFPIWTWPLHVDKKTRRFAGYAKG